MIRMDKIGDDATEVAEMAEEKAQKEAKARAEGEECLAYEINERKRAYEEMLKEEDNLEEELTLEEIKARQEAVKESLEEAESF